MPDPEPRPSRDLDAVPSFLRHAGARADKGKGEPAEPAGRPAMPRPATPSRNVDEPGPPRLDPATLPMPSLSRRRVVTLAGALAAALLTLGFARQVGEASAATDRAEDLRAANAALRMEVEGLERDLSHVQDPRFIKLAGRAFGLGGPGEIPFALAAGAPPLEADAPGSASVRLGAPPTHTSPLDAWLAALFGSSG
ncbi:MAG TPA: hypothetical protein VFP56_11160 [Candidatus Limnocylindrales bacterium]|nr:hypothetical protein [Candidatus Limnocylindrales bacterium]